MVHARGAYESGLPSVGAWRRVNCPLRPRMLRAITFALMALRFNDLYLKEEERNVHPGFTAAAGLSAGR